MDKKSLVIGDGGWGMAIAMSLYRAGRGVHVGRIEDWADLRPVKDPLRSDGPRRQNAPVRQGAHEQQARAVG